MKRKKVVVAREIRIVREDDKMTITLANADAKGTTRYFCEWCKVPKATLELLIADYIYRFAIVNGSPVLIDERIADEFKAITETPYKGEFVLAYTDGSGRVVNFAEWKEPYPVVYATPYHVEIRMFGDKVPLFEILYNGHALRCTNRCGTTWRAKEVDAWLIRLYQRRKQYPNLSIKVPRIVACFLDSLAVNATRIIRELNITFTEEHRVDDVVA